MRDVPYLMPLGKKDYNSRSAYKPKLGKYFQIYRYQLNFVMFCTTSVLDISWCHLNHPNLLAHSVYRFHVYFHVKIILHHLGISLHHEDGFRKVKISYIKNAYYSICDDEGVNANEI